MKLQSYNPANGELIGEVEITPVEDIKNVVSRSKSAQKEWAKKSVDERITLLVKAGRILQDRSEELAELLSSENGKSLSRSMSEVNGCAGDIRHRGTEVKSAIKTQVFSGYGTETQLQHNPLGVCAVIAPWNYPMSMAHWMIIPALVAGNSVVFKPSEETPLIAQEYVTAFQQILPENVIQIVHGDEEQGKALVTAKVDLITFTGSKEVGKDILKNCSARLTPVIMELGGKDPLIVLKDADIIKAAQFAVGSSFENSGQMCISTERIYVERSVNAQFENAVVSIAKQYKIGCWNNHQANIGPIINETQRNLILKHIEDAKAKGATVLLGGENHPDRFILPTVITDVTDDMVIFQDETFGPVVAISCFDDVDDAVNRANSNDLALGASVFGKEGVEEVAARLDAGMLGINMGTGSVGDTPWVGAKQSGYGYHGSPDGHRQFTQAKVVSRTQG